MIKKILLTLGLLLITSSVFAYDMALSWNGQAEATGYKIEHSIDGGVTWSAETDIGNITSVLYPVPNTGLVLARIAAYNNNGTTWRLDTGLFYNGDWKLPDKPTNVGAQ